MNKLVLNSFGSWQLVKPLGEGAFGEVHHWKHRITGQEIATKRLKNKLKLKSDELEILHKRWLQELKWLQTLKTPYIVSIEEIDDDDFLSYLAKQMHLEHPLPVIVMEYCNGGDLRGHLNKINNLNGLTEFEVRTVLRTLRHAVEYLHLECNIEHRDIKPENIVICIKGNQKMYKLTDFGYAREIPEHTVAQSVVGTRNYVAPEVFDPGRYTKTVDYWSVGNMAFEIICGIQPFIPHQKIVQRLTNIQLKPPECIAIVQTIEDATEERFEFIDKIFSQNHLSTIFIEGMEKWLRLSLDRNYKTRGFDCNNQLKFFTYLDELLNTKIVTVFSLKTYKKYYYDIETFVNAKEFINKVALDNQIEFNNIFIIHPTSHPKKSSISPIDFYVPEWCDTSIPGNPPVMLFVTEFLIENDHIDNINFEEHFTISDTIKKCMSISAHAADVPPWFLQQFEREVHFILSKEQHLLECYLMALHEYVMIIEHQVFLYEQDIVGLDDKVSQLCGAVWLFDTTVNEFRNFQKIETTKSSDEKAKYFIKESQRLKKSIVPSLMENYKSLLRNCKELATNHIYQEIAKSDIFNLTRYRKFLLHVHPISERLEEGQRVFEECLSEFNNFLHNSSLKKIRNSAYENIKIFNMLQQNVCQRKNDIFELEKGLEELNRTLIRQIFSSNNLLRSLSVSVDEETPNNSANGDRLLNDSSAIFDLETALLVEESTKLINDLKISMEIDENLPTEAIVVEKNDVEQSTSRT